MTIAVRPLFNKNWSVVWATTYTCGVVALDEYFLGQLRPDQLNVTILADMDALDDTWTAMVDTGSLSRLRRVNQEYLLRPVAWRSHAFHPKTYLFGNEAGGVLLVGSGNADLSGLVAGHEVFARFDSKEQSGAQAIASWRDWMARLIPLLRDSMVSERWHDAGSRLPWLSTLQAVPGTPIVSNLDAAIIDRLLEGAPHRVDELHVAAPFWDERLAALRELIDRTAPKTLDVYLGAGSRIDGKGLIALLKERKVNGKLWTYTEPRFVHAKLVGWVSGESGRLLSGSANVSYVALLADAQNGNVEMGVLVDAEPSEIRGAFQPPGLTLLPLTESDVLKLTPEPLSGLPLLPLRLLRGERLPDGHLSVAMTPLPKETIFVASIPPDGTPLRLDVAHADGTALYREIALGRTSDVWEKSASLVRLVSAAGDAMSNAIALDDRAALEAVLRGRNQEDRGALGELTWEELDTPVGRILEELQASCLFELKRAGGKARTPREAEPSVESDASFWQRLGAIDIEAVGAVQHGRFGRGRLDTDPVFAQLHAMLIQAPYLPELRAIRAMEPTEEEMDDPDAARHRWTMETRQRVRIFNILKRWCRAVRDPQIVALDPLITTHNYRALLQALIEFWRGDGEGGRYFIEDQLEELLHTLLESLLATGGVNKGAFLVIDDSTRDRMLADLRLHGATKAVADLVFDVLRPARNNRIAAVLRWQPLLISAMESGLVEPSPGPIADTLIWAAEFVDEEGWRRKVREQFGVDAEFSTKSLASGYEYMLVLNGLDSLLTDPRAVGVLNAALRFRPGSGVVLAMGRSDDRVSIRDGDRAFARIDGRFEESKEAVSLDEIRKLSSAVALDALFNRQERARAEA